MAKTDFYIAGRWRNKDNMGKKCYAVGELEKTETLYCIFDKIFPDIEALQTWLNK